MDKEGFYTKDGAILDTSNLLSAEDAYFKVLLAQETAGITTPAK